MRLAVLIGCVAVAGCGASDTIGAPPESQLPPGVKMAVTGFFFESSSRLVVLNTANGTQKAVSDSSNEVVWSPDGSKLAFARVRAEQNGVQALHVWEEASARDVYLDSTPVGYNCGSHTGCYTILHAFEPAWSPDSRELAYAWGSEIRILSADGSARRVLTLPEGGPVFDLAWSPDGKFLSYMDGVGAAIRGVSPTTPGPPVTLVQSSEGIGGYTWSPDAKRIAVGTGNSIAVYEGGRLVGSSPVPGVTPRWSPDGRRIGFFSTLGDIYTVNADGKEPNQVTFGGASGEGLSWTADSKMMVFNRYDGIFFVDMAGGAIYKALPGPIDTFAVTRP